MRKVLTKLALMAAATVLLAACSGQPLSTREKGTIFGGVLGAGSGAIIGSAVGAPGAGAAIGGALGAGTGYVVGNAMQNNETAIRHNQSQLSAQERE
ncbi:MAG TPA: glycine zipper domain-containing protein, partial [Candidatus Binataceae bacterium]|nr:glycine zipper domain-containing protein [Candidatus Binataceae bacterium]